MTSRFAVIINPISGGGGRAGKARDRIQLAESLAREHGVDAQVLVSEYAGHTYQLALSAVESGATTVVGWGGDGTLNQAGAALVHRDVTLGAIPTGSGNGLARELGIPLTPREAFAVAVTGRDRIIDSGEVDGRLFFNVAGIGLDARVAHQFANAGAGRRGFRRYLEITTQELFRSTADEYVVDVDGSIVRSRSLIIAIANSRQYGNGALIAPQAQPDDGQLDVVVIDDRPAWRSLLQVPRVFMGQIGRVPGVTMMRGVNIDIRSGRAMTYHLDGEPMVGGTRLTARVHRGALKVRVP